MHMSRYGELGPHSHHHNSKVLCNFMFFYESFFNILKGESEQFIHSASLEGDRNRIILNIV